MFYLLFISKQKLTEYFFNQIRNTLIDIIHLILYLNLPSTFKNKLKEENNKFIQSLNLAWLPEIIMRENYIPFKERKTFQKTFLRFFGTNIILYSLGDYFIFNQIVPNIQKIKFIKTSLV